MWFEPARRTFTFERLWQAVPSLQHFQMRYYSRVRIFTYVNQWSQTLNLYRIQMFFQGRLARETPHFWRRKPAHFRMRKLARFGTRAWHGFSKVFCFPGSLPVFLVSWFPEVLVSGCRSFLVSWFLISQCLGFLFSPNSVSTLGGSYSRCKGRCLIRVPTLGAGIFPVNFGIKWLLWNVEMHFDCAGLHKVCVCVLGWLWGAAFFL